MSTTSANNTKISIGGVLTMRNPLLADYLALTFVEIGEVESIASFGDKSAIITFSSLSDSRVRKNKGSRDAGTLAFTTAYDQPDLGQIAIEAAELTSFFYGFKVEIANAPSDDYTNEIRYLKCIVNSLPLDIGANDHIIRTMYECPIDAGIVKVIPSLST